MRSFLLTCRYSVARHSYAETNEVEPNNWSNSSYEMLVHAKTLEDAKTKFLDYVWNNVDDWYRGTKWELKKENITIITDRNLL